jgi:FAD/FMN-containing dehydrogenase
MSRFNNIVYYDAGVRPRVKQLTVGAGCRFNEIYNFMRDLNRKIVGGGADVGIGGWMTGGGYSLKTNQYGLGIDNLVRIQIVTPDGEVVTATEDLRSDLFWAVKVCAKLGLRVNVQRLM